MASSISFLRLLGAALLFGALSACSTSNPSATRPPKALTTPAGNEMPGPAPIPSVAGSTGGGEMTLPAGTIGVPPSSGSGGR